MRQSNHYPNKYPHVPPKKIQFVDEEVPVLFTKSGYKEEGSEMVPVYQVMLA